MWRIVLLVALAVGLATTASGAVAQTGGEHGVLHVDSGTAAEGQEVSVNIDLRGLPAPGLGAWMAALQYDSVHLTVVDCTALYNGVCNTTSDPNAIRASAAVDHDLAGDFTLVTVVFRCNDAGSVTELTPSISVFTTAVLPPLFVSPAVETGTITCAAATATPTQTAIASPMVTATPAATAVALPSTGGGGAAHAPAPWLPLALLVAGALAISFGTAHRRTRG